MGLAKHFESVWNSKGLMLTFYTVCYLSYIALGGLIFLVIEGGQEATSYNAIMAAKGNLMQKHPCLTEESVDEFLTTVMPHNGRGGVRLTNTSRIPVWTYSESVFFSVTLLTTVGYGHIAPISQLGKAMCMIYTGIGIPFTLMLLAAYVQRLMAGSHQIHKCLSFCLGSSLKPLAIRIIHQFTITLFIIIAFFIVPALILYHIEKGWTYLDCLYFCFISLTTVGLGDYVPGENPLQSYHSFYRFSIAGYILVGVTSMMFLMAVTADFQHTTMRKKEQDPERIPIVRDIESYGAVVVGKQNSAFAGESENQALMAEKDAEQIRLKLSAVNMDF